MRENETLKLPSFHGTRRDDLEQHWFTYEAIWAVMQTLNDHVNIEKSETKFRERVLTWYMKLKPTMSIGKAWMLDEIKQALLRISKTEV